MYTVDSLRVASRTNPDTLVLSMTVNSCIQNGQLNSEIVM